MIEEGGKKVKINRQINILFDSNLIEQMLRQIRRKNEQQKYVNENDQDDVRYACDVPIYIHTHIYIYRERE